MLPEDVKTALACMPEKDFSLLHMNLGMWVRNNWSLWSGGPLAKHFQEMGISHPDAMSSILLSSFRKQLRGEPVDLEGQVAINRELQRLQRMPEKPKCPVHGAKLDHVQTKFDSDQQTVVQLFDCRKKRELWAYEVDRGLYEPNEALLESVRRLHHIQGPRSLIGCQVPQTRPFKPSSYDLVFTAKIKELVYAESDDPSRSDDIAAWNSHRSVRSLLLRPVASWRGVSPATLAIRVEVATKFLGKDVGFSSSAGDVGVFLADVSGTDQTAVLHGFCDYDPLHLSPEEEHFSYQRRHRRRNSWMANPEWVRSGATNPEP